MHVWVRPEGIDVDTAVVVDGANAEPITVTVKPREWDALANRRARGRPEVVSAMPMAVCP